MRTWLRDKLFRFVRRVFATDDGRRILTDALRGQLVCPPSIPDPRLVAEMPYADLAARAEPALADGDAIFITARFRSGSTLLWNVFRHVAGCTAYYEPLNERRWFDVQARGNDVDSTHRNVTDYWREYDGLSELSAYYQERWIDRHLFMDERFWAPELKRYVKILIENAPGRPVLQFNRIDFRLPWFRRHFPGAKIVHLYRHPRDQWCSSLMDLARLPKNGTVAEFVPHDKFYLLTWANDLKYHFPFLDPTSASHPYQLFYYVWKLSYLFGRRYSDYSLAFEQLVQDPYGSLAELFAAVDVRCENFGALEKIVSAPPLGKWRGYADEAWFRDHETACESVLAEFFGTGCSKRKAASTIRSDHVEYEHAARH